MHSSGHPRWHGSDNFIVLFVSPPLYDHLLYWSIVNSFIRRKNCFVYEIYPQSETPHLTQIALVHFNALNPQEYPQPLLLPGTVIWYGLYKDRIVFRVWDYRLNHSISFSVDIDVDDHGVCNLEVYIFHSSEVLKLVSNSFIAR